MSCKIIRGTSLPPSGPAFFLSPEMGRSSTPAHESLPSERTAEFEARIVELEQEVRTARQLGLREGEKACRDQSAAELRPVLERLARSLHDLAELRPRVRREAEKDLVLLALAIAKRILRREVSVDPDAIGGLVKAAMEKLQTREGCRIRVHTSHAAFVRQHLDTFGTGGAEVLGEAGLEPGDVIVETSRGNLDASVNTQLREIERGFADRFGGSAA